MSLFLRKKLPFNIMQFGRIAFILMLYLKITVTAWPRDADAEHHAIEQQRRHARHANNNHFKNNSHLMNNTTFVCNNTGDDIVKDGVHHTDWHRVEMMDSNGLYWLEWWLKSKEIHFRVTVNTQGFIGLGFSRKTGRMSGADMVILWVDDRTGKPNALVSYSSRNINFLSTILHDDRTRCLFLIFDRENISYDNIVNSLCYERLRRNLHMKRLQEQPNPVTSLTFKD